MERLGPALDDYCTAELADPPLKPTLAVLQSQIENVALLAWLAQVFGSFRYGKDREPLDAVQSWTSGLF